MKESFRPKWAPHCVGEYDRAIDEDGRPVSTWVKLTCDSCGATHAVRCDSGSPRTWVLKWATVHLHRDALKDPFPKQGG